MFESYKHCFQLKDHKDLVGELSKIYARALSEWDDQQKQLEMAVDALKRSLEEKKIQ